MLKSTVKLVQATISVRQPHYSDFTLWSQTFILIINRSLLSSHLLLKAILLSLEWLRKTGLAEHKNSCFWRWLNRWSWEKLRHIHCGRYRWLVTYIGKTSSVAYQVTICILSNMFIKRYKQNLLSLSPCFKLESSVWKGCFRFSQRPGSKMWKLPFLAS